MGILSQIAASLPVFLGTAAALPPPAAAAPAPRSPRAVEYRERPSQVGGVGTRVNSGFLQDIDLNSEVRGEKWHGRPGVIGFAGKMLRDQAVRKSIDYILAPLSAAKWVFRPASSDPLDIEVADFMTWSFFENLPWSQIARRMGVSYFAHGFALEEITDAMRALPRDRFPNHPRPEAALVPTGFHQLPAWSVFRWHQSKTNPAQLESIQQYIPGSDAEKPGFPYVPADRFVRLTWDQDGADFDGLAILRSAYGAWKTKQLLLGLYVQGAERHAVGNPIGELGEDPSDEDVDAFAEGLASLRSNIKGWLLHPKDWKVKWESGAPGVDVLAGIEKCDTDIANNVGAGYMRLGLTGASGSHALAGTQQGHHHLEVDGHARFIATALWQGSDGWSAAERYVRANYGPDVAVPRPEAVNLPTRPWGDVAKTYFQGVQSGAFRKDGLTEDALREAMGLPPHDPASLIESAPTPVPMAAAGEDGSGATLDGEPAVEPAEGEDAEEEDAT